MTRQHKTPRQRAEEALAVAERKVKRLNDDVLKHHRALEHAQKDRDEAVVRRDYLKQDPALRNDQPRPTQEAKPA